MGPYTRHAFARRLRLASLLRRCSLLLLCAAVLTVPTAAWAQKTVILVRHAERQDSSTDSPLSAVGKARADALAGHLRTSGITAIYVTEFQRTQQTAAPTASLLAVAPTVVKGSRAADLVARIRKEQPEGVVLVVGHSNTVPEVIKQFGHAAAVTIADDEFDSLFVLTPATGTMVRLRY